MLWAADTGPVLHLGEAGALHRLPLLGEVVLPPAVQEELLRLRLQAGPPDGLNLRPLTPFATTQADDWCKAGLVDRGEAQAIALATQTGADYFLTDDAAARLLAATLGLRARGSLGEILWLTGQKQIPQAEAENYLEKLASTSLWVAPRIMAEARAALRMMGRP